MKKTNLFLDLGIFISFLIVMEPHFSGIPIHEWLSVALAATIVVHLLMHWNWVTGVGSRFFERLWNSSRLKYMVDLLLFMDFVTIMLSGIMISRIILPTLGLSFGHTNMTWRTLHSLSTDAGILLVGLHFALNWDWVKSTIKHIAIHPISGLIRPVMAAQSIRISNNENNQTRGD